MQLPTLTAPKDCYFSQNFSTSFQPRAAVPGQACAAVEAKKEKIKVVTMF
jgi:hypothetical protein